MSRGVISIPVTKSGEILLLPPVDEPIKKKEMVVGSELPMEEVVGYEFPAGAIDDWESEKWGIIREIWEEAGLLATFSQLLDAEFGVRVKQMRGGHMVEYGANIVYLLLTDLQEKYLKIVKEARLLSDVAPIEIRPRDRAIKELLSNRAND